MADRYWVGGAGTWNSGNTANWSASSGGAGGASVPTASDDVYFNSLSGTGLVTVSGTVNALNLAHTTASISFTGASSPVIRAYGDVFMQEDLDNITLRMYGVAADFTMSGYQLFGLVVEAGATVSCGFGLDIVSFVSVTAGGILELANSATSVIPSLALPASAYLRSDSIGLQAQVELTDTAVLYGSVRDIEIQAGIAYYGDGAVDEGNNEGIGVLGSLLFGSNF